MATILWGTWQTEHITRRHGVSGNQFDVAWHDPRRQDLEEQVHELHGPYYVSIGNAYGHALKMIWRWDGRSESVWPITAFFPTPPRLKRTRKR